MDEKQRGNCQYTPGINCDDTAPQCSKCGWNPEVSAKRLQKIRTEREQKSCTQR